MSKHLSSSVSSMLWMGPQHPYKFKAHMEFGEVRKSTLEEKEQNIAAQKKALEDAEKAKESAEAAAKSAE